MKKPFLPFSSQLYTTPPPASIKLPSQKLQEAEPSADFQAIELFLSIARLASECGLSVRTDSTGGGSIRVVDENGRMLIAASTLDPLYFYLSGYQQGGAK